MAGGGLQAEPDRLHLHVARRLEPSPLGLQLIPLHPELLELLLKTAFDDAAPECEGPRPDVEEQGEHRQRGIENTTAYGIRRPAAAGPGSGPILDDSEPLATPVPLRRSGPMWGSRFRVGVLFRAGCSGCQGCLLSQGGAIRPEPPPSRSASE
ncbi:MAG: hypothetical protein FJX77_06250 [Armatimonadetes bacterium]|nr:hypothetical protein [Armatimonadota bacterium]